jgi:hypothetical protein
MLTYLHNGNRAKYEKYKTKTRQAMCDVLAFVMEKEGDFTVEFLLEKEGEGSPLCAVAHNEGISLRQGEKMKNFADNLEFYDAIAEYVGLYK